MTYFGRTSPQINVLSVESVGYYPCRDYTFDESVQSKNASNNVPYFDRVTHNDSTKTEENRPGRWGKFVQWYSSMRPCLYGLILGILVCGLALAVIITLWLISPSQSAKITTATIITQTTVTTTTTTSVTTTTTTTSVPTTTTTTSVTTTTTTTSVTTTTTTTTVTTTTQTTTRPIICPSATWHPNGTTVAGSSTAQGGSKPSLLDGPYDVRVDSALNVYVPDFYNERFMKWAPNSTNGTIFGPKLGYGGSSDTNHLNTAATLCFDSTESNVYLSDTYNCRILKMNIASGNITVVIGPGCGSTLNKFYWCDGLYVDRFDNLYVSDWINDRVLKFPPNTNPSTNGVIVAGTGTAGSSLSQLDTPWNIYVDESDNDALYIADYANHRIMKWYPNDTSGIVVAGGNGAGSKYNQLNNPQAVYVDLFGTVYVADYNNHRIMKWRKNTTNGTLVAGISGSAGTSPAHLYNPSGIYFDKNGDMYVSEYSNDRIQRFTIDTTSC